MNLKRFNRALVPSCFKESEILYAKCRLYISSKLSRSEMTLTVRRNQNSFHDLLKCATTIAAKHDHERYFGYRTTIALAMRDDSRRIWSER